MTAPLMAWWMMLDRVRVRSVGAWAPATQLVAPTSDGPITPVPRVRSGGVWAPARQEA